MITVKLNYYARWIKCKQSTGLTTLLMMLLTKSVWIPVPDVHCSCVAVCFGCLPFQKRNVDPWQVCAIARSRHTRRRRSGPVGWTRWSPLCCPRCAAQPTTANGEPRSLPSPPDLPLPSSRTTSCPGPNAITDRSRQSHVRIRVCTMNPPWHNTKGISLNYRVMYENTAR